LRNHFRAGYGHRISRRGHRCADHHRRVSYRGGHPAVLLHGGDHRRAGQPGGHSGCSRHAGRSRRRRDERDGPDVCADLLAGLHECRSPYSPAWIVRRSEAVIGKLNTAALLLLFAGLVSVPFVLPAFGASFWVNIIAEILIWSL